MVRKRERFFVLVLSVIHVCVDASLGHVRNARRGSAGEESMGRSEHPIVKREWYPLNYPGMLNVPVQYPVPNLPNSPYKSLHKTSKKSDLPEKGQIKFMKTLLGKVKTLLNNDESKKKNSSEQKNAEEKISHMASNNDKLYGVLGDSEDSGDNKDKEGEKSVNVISIPLKALGKVSKTESSDSDKDSASELFSDSSQSRDRGSQVVLRPLPVRSESEDGREEIPSGSKRLQSSLLPVIFQTPAGQQNQGGPMMIINPQTRTLQPLSDFTGSEVGSPLESPRVPYVLERHGDIEHSKSDVYRDIGHIPGEFRSQEHTPDDAGVGKTNLRHKNPERYGSHTSQNERDDDRYDDDDDDDDYDDDDDGDDDDDDDDDDNEGNAPQMNAEEREIAATRKRLFSMLPGNDPTYTSENRGLNLMNAAASMQMPEAFLGNPMLRGMGFNQRNSLPFASEAMAGEHADNSNDRNVFMLGNQGTRQVFGDSSSNAETNQMRTPPMMVNNGGFTLGGSPAQAMSPNEVSYILQKQGMINNVNELSQKDKISRPKITRSGADPENVLIEVNGKPIGETKDLRNHVVGGTVVKGQEKVIKSKGPLDIKISHACDGVHAKVVDISSSTKIKIVQTKSKIAKVIRGC